MAGEPQKQELAVSPTKRQKQDSAGPPIGGLEQVLARPPTKGWEQMEAVLTEGQEAARPLTRQECLQELVLAGLSTGNHLQVLAGSPDVEILAGVGRLTDGGAGTGCRGTSEVSSAVPGASHNQVRKKSFLLNTSSSIFIATTLPLKTTHKLSHKSTNCVYSTGSILLVSSLCYN